jgi:hypothetical protein
MGAEQAKRIGIARGQQRGDARAKVVHGRGFWRRRAHVRHGAILAEAARTANWRCEASCSNVLEKKKVGLPVGGVQDKVGGQRLILKWL